MNISKFFNKINVNNFKNILNPELKENLKENLKQQLISVKKFKSCEEKNAEEYQNCQILKCKIYILRYYIYLNKKNRIGTNESYYQRKIRDHYKKLTYSNKKLVKTYIEKIFNNFKLGSLIINFGVTIKREINNTKILSILKNNNVIKITNNTVSINKITNNTTSINNTTSKNNKKYNFSYKENNNSKSKLLKTESLINNRPDNLYIKINYNKQIRRGTFSLIYPIEGNTDYILRLTIINDTIKIIEKLGNKNNFDLTKICPDSVVRCIEYGNINNIQQYSILEKGIIDVNVLREKLYKLKNNQEFINFYLQIIIKLIKHIKCLHDNNYLHLDIKPENCMIFEGTQKDHDIEISESLNKDLIKLRINLTKYIKVKYVDFGFSKKFNNVSSKEPNYLRGTQKFLSKKFFTNLNEKKAKYDYMVDLYALGRMFAELILKLNDKELIKVTKRQFNNNPTENDYNSLLKFIPTGSKYKNYLKQKMISLIPSYTETTIPCLEGVNRQDSYQIMINILNEIIY